MDVSTNARATAIGSDHVVHEAHLANLPPSGRHVALNIIAFIFHHFGDAAMIALYSLFLAAALQTAYPLDHQERTLLARLRDALRISETAAAAIEAELQSRKAGSSPELAI